MSGGLYASLNCGFGAEDAREAVAENRARIAASLGVAADRLVSNHQVHSADVVVVETPWLPTENPRAVGLVTRQPGVALGVLAADCVPILFADPAARVIGAAHARLEGRPRRHGRGDGRRDGPAGRRRVADPRRDRPGDPSAEL